MIEGKEDGPSKTLLKYIGEADAAPETWKGYRELTSK